MPAGSLGGVRVRRQRVRTEGPGARASSAAGSFPTGRCASAGPPITRLTDLTQLHIASAHTPQPLLLQLILTPSWRHHVRNLRRSLPSNNQGCLRQGRSSGATVRKAQPDGHDRDNQPYLVNSQKLIRRPARSAKPRMTTLAEPRRRWRCLQGRPRAPAPTRTRLCCPAVGSGEVGDDGAHRCDIRDVVDDRRKDRGAAQ